MRRASRFWSGLASVVLLGACGSDDAAPPAGGAGTAQGGKAAGGAGGAVAGSGGASGASAGQAGKGGSAGGGGATSGAGGASGKSGGAGVSGSSGQAGAGASGASGAGAGGQAGGAGQGGAGASGASGAGAGGSAGGMAGEGGASGGAGGPACPDDCKGLCVGGACCDLLRACGEVCCDQGQVCSFNQCVTPTKTCFDVSECAATEFCDTRLQEESGQGGAGGTCTGSAAPGKCLPRPPVCPGGEPPPSDKPVTCVGKCEVMPTPAPFEPEQRYAWGGELVAPYASDVMMTPIVVQLDDDNCDGKVNERDIPEIVFSTFSSGAYTAAGTLHVISVKEGALVEKWSVPGAFYAGKQIAGADLDGQPGAEIVGCTTNGQAQAYTSDGKLLWTSDLTGCGQPAIADMDQDGKPEVVIEGGILNGADGTTKAAFSPKMLGTFAISDLDGDGKLDVVSASQGYHADGMMFVEAPAPAHTYSVCTSTYYFCAGPAVADLDKDGKPEVLAVYFNQHQLGVWQYDPDAPSKVRVVRSGIDLNTGLDPLKCNPNSAGAQWGGGPATVGDFNADTFPDVALAGGVGYAVFDGKSLMDSNTADTSTFLWTKNTQDCSSAGTGSSLFDFNGDGKAEVLYADETTLHIYEGATGNVLYETCNTSGTISEYPIVADVDNDGQADIVVAANAYSGLNCAGTKTSGIRVFGSKNNDWVRTRRVWNQHPYHVTNINEDGTVPAVEPTNWQQPGLNNFRQNKQPGSEFSAPDAIVSLLAPRCDKAGDFEGLVATVRNVGEAVLPAGVTVSFYAGTPPAGKLVGQGYTTLDLYPAQGQDVTVLVSDADLASGKTPAYAVVDDAGEPHPLWAECRTDNNTSIASAVTCGKF